MSGVRDKFGDYNISRQLVFKAQVWLISLVDSIDKEGREGIAVQALGTFQELEWRKRTEMRWPGR